MSYGWTESAVFGLKMGFHPAIAKSVPAAVRRFTQSMYSIALSETVFGMPADVRIAWCNTLPALTSIVRASMIGRR